MTRPNVGAEGESSGARLELWFACPHCGAPASADEASSSVECAHCQSLLLIARPDAPVVGMAECVLRSDDDLRRSYIERRLAQRRADLCAQPGDGEVGAQWAAAAGRAISGSVGGPVGMLVAGVMIGGVMATHGGTVSGSASEPPFLAAMLRAEKERLEASVRLGERRLLNVPYWQVRALILQCILGRERKGDKVVSVRARVAEQSTPAYDTSRWNMRDKDMRVGTARMKLLTPHDAASGAIFLPVAADSSPQRDDIERRGRLPPQDIDRLHVRSELVGAREFLVYRPIWLVQLLEGGEETWLLIEASTGIIAGNVVDASELSALVGERGVDPLAGVPQTSVTLAASRCVECGQDLPHDPGPWMRACARCRTGLALTSAGLVRAAYDHARPAAVTTGGAAPADAVDITWIPCWSYRFALRTPAGEMIVSLEELGAALGVPPALRGAAGDRIHVPATRMLGLPRGTKAFDDLCQWLHRTRLQFEAGSIGVAEPGPSAGVDLRESEARELARGVLHALLDPPMIARLTAVLVREKLDQPELLLADARLLFVAAPSRLMR